MPDKAEQIRNCQEWQRQNLPQWPRSCVKCNLGPCAFTIAEIAAFKLNPGKDPVCPTKPPEGPIAPPEGVKEWADKLAQLLLSGFAHAHRNDYSWLQEMSAVIQREFYSKWPSPKN